jgi:hypothetical protein
VLDQMITTGILEKLTANGSSTQFISSLADLPSLSRCLLGQDVPTSTNGHQNSKSRLPNQ